MQITIDIPDELSHLIPNKGKSLDVAIIEALGLYVQHDAPTNPTQIEIDCTAKWEQWFIECETMPILMSTQPPQNDYTALLIDQYRQ